MKPHADIIPVLMLALILSACATTPETGSKPKKEVPQQQDRSTLNQLGKSDFDRMADVEMRENTESLRSLMLKLYKRNPLELKKSTSDPAEKMVSWVFDGSNQHQFLFPEINNQQSTDAIFLAFKPEYNGDRVFSFIVGLYTMLLRAHNDKADFYLTWKLSNARKQDGTLYLLTNEMNETEKNLSFEREFGKMIGRTDLYAISLAEKSQRFISRIMQNLATAVFLPI